MRLPRVHAVRRVLRRPLLSLGLLGTEHASFSIAQLAIFQAGKAYSVEQGIDLARDEL